MNEDQQRLVLEHSGAKSIVAIEPIQALWSGYGQISRVQLTGASVPSLIVKHVQFKTGQDHPRGWNSEFAHQRKLKSYRVESHWYQAYSGKSTAPLPKCLFVETFDDGVFLLLQDLDVAGFPIRKSSLGWPEMQRCIGWLAQFHASFLNVKPKGLWAEGSYWHLATRPHELAVLDDPKLKEAAPKIAAKLKSSRYQTLIHGDAKLANFCFAQNGDVAAVDFQYVGGGCGMKDLAYFVGSCLEDDDCQRYEASILDHYFKALQQALGQCHRDLEIEWRGLYSFAWADFHRFLKGWSPGHWKLNCYSEKITKAVIESL